MPGFHAGNASMDAGIAPPHSFSSWRKRMRRARWKKKSLGPNLPVRASLGMRRLIASFPQICPVPSECAIPRQSSSLQAASCNAFSNSGVLVETPYLWPRCRSVGGVSKEGAAAPSLCRLKGWSRRGRPKSPSWRVFWTVHGAFFFAKTKKNGGCIAQPSSWLSLPCPGMDAMEHPHCGPAATAGPNTASAGGH